MKYTLIAKDEFEGATTTREFNVDYLPDVLSEIELFLRGAGFVFNGNLDFVNDLESEPESYEVTQEMVDAIAAQHSKYYGDTERNR
jgi:hypothetical protein